MDVGTRARRVTVDLHLVGLGFRLMAPAPFSDWLEQGTYHVNDDATYTAIIENVGAVVQDVERRLDQVEALLPPTPAW